MKLENAFKRFLVEKKRAAKTRLKYQSKLGKFLEAHHDKTVRQITPELVEKHFGELERRGLATATLASHYSAHNALWNFCVKQRWMKRNPAQHLRRYSDSPVTIRYADEKDIEAVNKICEEWTRGELIERRDAAIWFVTLCSTGRRGEVMHLRLSTTEKALRERGEAYTINTHGKTGDTGLVLNEKAAQMVRNYLELRPPTRHNQLWVTADAPHEPLGENGLQHVRRRLCHAAGVDIITYQELRRHRAKQIGELYGTATASRVLGHRGGETTLKRFYYNPERQVINRAIIETM